MDALAGSIDAVPQVRPPQRSRSKHDVEGWRTLAEVARDLGITDRTLRQRLKEAGIRAARPGRIAMLSEADVTKLMEQSRNRRRLPTAAPQQAPSVETPQQRARSRQDMLVDIVDIRRLIDKSC